MARASTTRKTRSSAATSPQRTPSAGKRGRGAKAAVRKPAKDEESISEQELEEKDATSDEEDNAEDDTYNSDALDDEDDTARNKAKASLKRKRRGVSGSTSAYFESPKKKPRSSTAKSPTKPNKANKSRKKKQVDEDEEEAEETGEEGDAGDEDFELEEGQEVVGKVVKAPTTGRVPPGQISRNTFDFLTKLKDPKCNDRQWFKLHEPVYRLAEKEWKDFIESFTDLLVEVDTQVPPLPPKDVIHRIYRDIRFSNDKTPYKRGFSASFSRSGRKGIFAGYHVAVKPGGESMMAAGTWCPGRNELATIRANILQSPTRLRRILSNPTFVKHFGKPEPRKDGGRQSVFGMEDELKTAPKGVDKNHEDIDLLRLRSFAVSRRFTDEEVLDPGFKEQLAEMIGVTRDLVHCLNDMMTIGGGGTGNAGGNTNGAAGRGRTARATAAADDGEEDDVEEDEGDADEDA